MSSMCTPNNVGERQLPWETPAEIVRFCEAICSPKLYLFCARVEYGLCVRQSKIQKNSIGSIVHT